MWRRGGVQEPIPGEPQWPIYVLWIPPLPRPPLKDRPVSIGFKPAKWNTQWCPVNERVDRRIWWLTVSKAGREIQQNEDWWFGIGFCNSQGFSGLRVAQVSVEWPLLETWLFSVQFVVPWKKQWDLVKGQLIRVFWQWMEERDSL